jgi:trans-aconitate methyltransferase
LERRRRRLRHRTPGEPAASPRRDVVAIDTDAAALTRAAQVRAPNITFMRGDVMSHPSTRAFDFIALVAVLHHLPLEPALERFKLLQTTRRPGRH